MKGMVGPDMFVVVYGEPWTVRALLAADGWYAMHQSDRDGTVYQEPVVCWALLQAQREDARPDTDVGQRVVGLIRYDRTELVPADDPLVTDTERFLGYWHPERKCKAMDSGEAGALEW